MRTKEEIQQDYMAKCARLGEKEYHKVVLDSEKSALIEDLKGINLEMAELMKVESEKKTQESIAAVEAIRKQPVDEVLADSVVPQ